MANTPRNYWMVAVRPEYYDKCAEMGFNLLGLGRNQRKRVQRMEIGDRVLFYVVVREIFGVAASVCETFVEDETPVWPSIEQNELYAWRVGLKPDVMLDEAHAIDARLIAPRLQYVKKWAPEHWPLAFQGLLHLIPKQDFSLIEDEMNRGRLKPTFALGGNDRYCALDKLASRE